MKFMANVIVMRVPKDKLQQEIEHKALDGWKLRKMKEKMKEMSHFSEKSQNWSILAKFKIYRSIFYSG
jgi:hypothetical protein